MPPLNSAFDPSRPNGSGRRPLGDRVIYVFRVYRKQVPLELGDLGDGFLGDLRRGIRQARQVVQNVQGFLAPVNSPLTGLILEREYKFTLILEGFEQTPEVRANFSYTNDDFFIDKPFRNAKGVTRFRIRGRTFWTPILIDGVPVDGDAALKEFKELIDDFLFPKEGSPSDRVLYWYDLNAPISGEDQFGEFEWLIHPFGAGVRILQSAQKPFLRYWQFEFLGLQSNRDRAKAEDGFLAGLFSRDFLKRLLDLFGLGALADLLDTVFGAVDDFTGLLQDLGNLVTTVNDYIQGVADLIKYSFGKVRALITALETLVGRVEDGIDLLRSLPDLVGDEADFVRDQLRLGWPGLELESDNGIRLCDQLSKIRTFLLALAAQPQSFVAPIDGSTSLSRALSLRVAPGTTIERIAHAAHVDVATLIRVNGLAYPFVEARPKPERQLEAANEKLAQAEARLASEIEQGKTGLELAPFQQGVSNAQFDVGSWEAAAAAAPSAAHVLYAGDLIRIPVERPEALPSIIGVDGNQILALDGVTEEERLFGIDLLLDERGNLVWDDEGSDLVLSRGLENIHRAQLRYVGLPLGALRFAPGIGNFAFEDLNRWQGHGTNRLLAHSIQKTLSQDPRVQSVDDLRAETHAGRAIVRYNVTLINGESVPDLRLPIAA